VSDITVATKSNNMKVRHSVYRGQGLEKIQLVEPILSVNLSATEWSASLLSLLFFITLVLITTRGLTRRPIDYQ
jgi:hypothetical protein